MVRGLHRQVSPWIRPSLLGPERRLCDGFRIKCKITRSIPLQRTAKGRFTCKTRMYSVLSCDASVLATARADNNRFTRRSDGGTHGQDERWCGLCSVVERDLKHCHVTERGREPPPRQRSRMRADWKGFRSTGVRITLRWAIDLTTNNSMLRLKPGDRNGRCAKRRIILTVHDQSHHQHHNHHERSKEEEGEEAQGYYGGPTVCGDTTCLGNHRELLDIRALRELE